MGRKYVSADENATTIAWFRACLIQRWWGTPTRQQPTSIYAVARVRKFLMPKYQQQWDEIETQIPTNRFTDQELIVMNVLAHGYLVQKQMCGTDSVTWGYTRAVVQQRAIDLSKQLGQTHALRTWSAVITRILTLIDQTQWMHRKVFGKGHVSLMEPTDITMALWTLPQVREDSPTLLACSLTPLEPPTSPKNPAQAGVPLLSTVGVSETDMPTMDTGQGETPAREWLDLEKTLFDGRDRLTPAAAWKYHNKRGRKAAVLFALRKHGVKVQDLKTGASYTQQWEHPETGEIIPIDRPYKERWVRLPEGMTIRQLIHIVEGKL